MRGTGLHVVGIDLLPEEHFALCFSIWMNFRMNQSLAMQRALEVEKGPEINSTFVALWCLHKL